MIGTPEGLTPFEKRLVDRQIDKMLIRFMQAVERTPVCIVCGEHMPQSFADHLRVTNDHSR